MLNLKKDFIKFAASKLISSTKVYNYVNHINPNIVEEHKLNVSCMDVFSRLLMDRIVFLGTEIDLDVANVIQAQLLYLASLDDKAPISLYLNTPGGIVTAGLGIYDTMNLVSPPVNTICTGLAASMGSVLLSAGNERSILPHAKVMIHQPLGGVSGQAEDIIIEAREIEKAREELYTILSKNTNQSFEKIAADADRDYWMTAQEAKDYGIVDKIL